MLTIRYLTDKEKSRIDPYNTAPKWEAIHFTRATESKPLNHSAFFDDPEVILDNYKNRFCTTEMLTGKHGPIVSYDLEMTAKYGPQGGRLTYQMGDQLIRGYYEHADAEPKYDSALIGLTYFLQLIDEAIEKYGRPVVQAALVISSKFAGLPYGGHKNDPLVHYAVPGPYADPIAFLAGTRFMRNKPRIIFPESVLNLDRYQYSLNAVRNWLKMAFPHLFGAWLNPYQTVIPDFTFALEHGLSNIEIDARSMDNYFTWPLVRDVVLPVYERILPPADYMRLAAMVEAEYRAPLYFDGKLYTGLHATFSGVGYTNDFETIYDIVCAIGCMLRAGCTESEILHGIKALGDDVTLTVPKSKANKVLNFSVNEYKLNCIALNEEKTRFDTHDIRFCRQVYYTHGKRILDDQGRYLIQPAYPPVLSLNNVVQPERPADSWRSELLNDLIRLDNCEGYYASRNYYDFVFNHMKPVLVNLDDRENKQYFEDYQRQDWWYSINSELKTLDQSPSAQVYKEYYSKWRKKRLG